MKILIVGGDGMLGNELFAQLSRAHEVRVTVRRELAAYEQHGVFTSANTFSEIDVRCPDAVVGAIELFEPDAIVNATAVVRQRPDASDPVRSIEVNALFPHRLVLIAQKVGARVLHVSTDCVFSGSRGAYTELDVPDPIDLYGATKHLGEVTGPGSITLRTSLIGLELHRRLSLVEWALAQTSGISGYRHALWSGLTTMEFARVVERTLIDHPDLIGLWHVSGPVISKYDLLVDLMDLIGRDIDVEPDESFVCDRTLGSAAFRAATGWQPPTWNVMLAELGHRIRERERLPHDPG